MTRKLLGVVLVVVAAVSLTVKLSEPPAGAASLSNPVTTQNCDGRAEQFAVDSGRHLEHRWQTTPGGSWSAWNSLGGYLVYDGLAASQNVDCRLEVFGVGGDYAMWHIWQTTAGGGWSNWASLGNNAGNFSTSVVNAGTTSYGGLILWAWTNGGATYACDYEKGRASGPWNGWEPAAVCKNPIQD